ncbi:HAD hydrolase-like protein [Aestuariispira insulae]|uniref:Phosphoglycolate phosphatase n=1 Tax=Aestuariispira insulae TaxID=1461337 RepID=A0A3D9HPT4_9PROT|nr:HAD hydrolase-like protein [Aestuariispira insulae]RED51415.1 phosphoglycolate phosphatase [Aestuariispira insulae]
MKSILFDLDGTIIDPKIGILKSIQYALEKLGAAVPGIEDLRWCIGPSLRVSFPKLLGIEDKATIEEAVRLYRERFKPTGLYEYEPYPGAMDGLAALASEYRLFLATAKPQVYAAEILRHMGAIDHFEKVYGDDMEGTFTDKGDLLAFILEEQGLAANSCVMIGDRHHDIQAATRHGMPSVAVSYGYALDGEFDDHPPTAISHGFHDLSDRIGEILAA